MQDNDDDPFDDTISAEQSVAQLVQLLTLERHDENSFTGRRKIGGKGRIFGGQAVAQALAAAQATVPAGRDAHSLHAYFLRGGDEDFPVDYAVARDFDGRSFSNRRVIASQNGKPILNLTASFHKDEQGLEHQLPMPEVQQPEDMLAEADYYRLYTGAEPPRIALLHKSRGYEVRLPAGKPGDGSPPEPSHMWFRTPAPLPDDPAMHRLVLAYLSDYGLLGAASIPHRVVWRSGEMVGASLDHAVWFHKEVRADQWMLYVLDSPWAGNALGFSRGRFYSHDGRLVASTAQEGLMRVKQPAA
ncbi:thioesterase family protein [Croceicoccus sp. F390]|uniref:Thioesterase family protein n=1 Tax=Croceicoccus esteveae TaxID=3075597 RepID=A0ABU2ZG61_9SPHN|nr:acyl-CoA thioesterase domain-containing protein [Croceicoccus sp. F390]MDT0575590.1 thioesterase family protein [Croceicoccus sp. F390]